MTRDEKLALALFGLIVGMGFIAIVAFKGWQHAAWERDRTCQMARVNFSVKQDSLFLTYAHWCPK